MFIAVEIFGAGEAVSLTFFWVFSFRVGFMPPPVPPPVVPPPAIPPVVPCEFAAARVVSIHGSVNLIVKSLMMKVFRTNAFFCYMICKNITVLS